MLKTIGRIGLLVVGGLLIWRGIAQFMSDWNTIQTYQGGFMKLFQDFLSNKDAQKLVISFLKDILWFLVALTSIICGIVGRGGFWMFLFLLVSLAFIGYDIYNKVQTGAFQKDMWGAIKGTIADFAIQLGYVAACIVLKIGNKQEEKKEEAEAA